MICYHPYAVPLTARQRPTWSALRRIPGVRHIPCVNAGDYESHFRQAWDLGAPFLICEHDIVPTPAMIHALTDCPYPFCAQSYLLTHAAKTVHRLQTLWPTMAASATGRGWPGFPDLSAYLHALPPFDPSVYAVQTVAHRVATEDGWRWGQPEDTWADWVGFGLTKCTPDVPLDRTDWRAGSWRDLDSRVSDWTHARGIRWHIHWPLAAHYHVLEG